MSAGTAARLDFSAASGSRGRFRTRLFSGEPTHLSRFALGGSFSEAHGIEPSAS